MQEEHRFKVNLKGVIDLLSKHIYKSEDVFIRELLQNATDAITARKAIDTDFSPSLNIDLYENEEISTIAFIDNGIGLTEADIHKFIATIGQSSKKQLDDEQITDFIGHFGIGLLSCFMVSDKIVMISRHVNETQGYVWEGKPDGVYHVKKAEKDVPVGTTVYLTSAKDKLEFFSFDKLRKLLHHYGNLLPHPIYLRADDHEVLVNEKEPLWFRGFSEVEKQEVINFGNHVFQDQFLDAFPINTQAGEVKGVAYVLKRRANPSNKQESMIYLKRMFLSNTSKDILPQWAFFIRVIVNANNLKPTASREEFHDDALLTEARVEIGKTLKKYLLTLPDNNQGLFEQFLQIHGLTLKSLAVDDDDLFRLLIKKLTFQTSLGDMTGEDIMKSTKNIAYTSSLEEFRQNAGIFNSQNELLINGGYVYDSELIRKIERIFPEYTAQMSQSTDLLNLMHSPDISTQNKVELILDTVNSALRPYECVAEFKAFEPVELPTLISRDAQFGFYKDIKDAEENTDALFSSIMGSFKKQFKATATVCYNVNNSLVQKLLNIQSEEEIKFVAEMLYCQAMIMGHYPLRNGELQILNSGILKLLSSYS